MGICENNVGNHVQDDSSGIQVSSTVHIRQLWENRVKDSLKNGKDSIQNTDIISGIEQTGNIGK